MARKSLSRAVAFIFTWSITLTPVHARMTAAPLRGVPPGASSSGAAAAIEGAASPRGISGMQLGGGAGLALPGSRAISAAPSFATEETAAPAAVSALLNAPALQTSPAPQALAAYPPNKTALGGLKTAAAGARQAVSAGRIGEGARRLNALFGERSRGPAARGLKPGLVPAFSNTHSAEGRADPAATGKSSSGRRRGKLRRAVSFPKRLPPGSSEDLKYSLWKEYRRRLGAELFVKFVVFLDEDGAPDRLVFLDGARYPTHAVFLKRLHAFKRFSLEEIDHHARQDPKVLYGVLFGDFSFLPAHSGFQLNADAPVPAEHAAKIKALLAGRLDRTPELPYRPVPALLASVTKDLDRFRAAGLKLLLPKPKRESVTYHAGWAVGTLRFMRRKDWEQAFPGGGIRPADILVLDHIPEDLPPVAGIILSKETSPASHLVLLARAMNIPVVYYPRAFKAAGLLRHKNKQVFLKTEQEGEGPSVTSEIQPQALEDLQRLKDRRVSAQPLLDFSVKPIVAIARLTPQDNAAYGGKGAQLGAIAREAPAHAPRNAVGVPLHYYRRFLREAGVHGRPLGDFIAEALSRIRESGNSQIGVLQILASIRSAILEARMPSPLLKELHRSLSAYFPADLALIFRSSGNAEDTKEFNAAGLHESAFGSLNELERAFKAVWSSLFTGRAFLTRRLFAVLEESVGMGLVVAPRYHKVLANGVALFTLDGENAGAVISGFPGDQLSTVRPPAGRLPEAMELSYDRWESELRPRLRTASTELPAGSSLLKRAEYLELYAAMERVAQKRRGKRTTARELNFEWALIIDESGKRRLVLDQLRDAPPRPEPLKGGFLILGAKGMRFHVTHHDESANSFAALQAPRDLRVDMRSITREELARGEVAVPRVRWRGSENAYEITDAVGKIKTDAYGFRVSVDLPNPELPNLRMGFSFSLAALKPGRSQDDPLFTLADARSMGLTTSPEDFIAPSGDRSPIGWSLAPHDNPPRWRRIKSNPITIQDGLVSVTLHHTQERRGDAGIAFYRVRATVRGLLKEPLQIRNPRSAVHAPSHHNRYNEYLIDLYGAENITPAGKRALQRKKIRYVMVGFSRTQGRYSTRFISEDGKKTNPKSLLSG